MATRRIATKFGTVFHRDTCKSDWGNIVTSTWYRRKVGRVYVPFKKRPVAITLQKPAMDAFRAVEDKLGFQVFVTGSHRTCAYQRELYARDPRRYAHPNSGVHTHGLAVDVDSTQLGKVGKNGKTVRETFRAVGWKQSRPDDEPWHHSWGVTA